MLGKPRHSDLESLQESDTLELKLAKQQILAMLAAKLTETSDSNK